MTVEQIINAINEASICGLPYVEDEDIADVLGKPVAEGLYPEEHRWYWISTDVYKVGDRYIGLEGVSSLKSESMGYIDAGIDVIAYEMEPVLSTTYKPK